jgi:transcription elongation factor Elf1
MSGPKLLGCPFCGKQPRSATHLSYSNYGVTCGCGATGPTFNAGYRPLLAAEVKAVHDAIEAWNTRTPTPPAEVTVDSLMEMAQEYASAWSLVGGPFDRGDMLDDATDAKERLRRAIAAALAARGGR